QAWLRLVDLDVVVQGRVAGCEVGKTESDILDLAFDSHVVLVNAPVFGGGIESADALGGDASGPGGEGIRKGEQRLAVLDGVEKGLVELEWADALRARKEAQRFGEHAVTAADDELAAQRPPGDAYPRHEVAQGWVLLCPSGTDFD